MSHSHETEHMNESDTGLYWTGVATLTLVVIALIPRDSSILLGPLIMLAIIGYLIYLGYDAYTTNHPN